MSRIKCLRCGSSNLVHYTEETYSMQRRITKKNTISKVIYSKYNASYGMPNYIECLDCGQKHDYETDDDSGKILEFYIMD